MATTHDQAGPPPQIEQLAERRAEARRARDFAMADRLKAEIEDAGWKVIDAGTDYRLEPAHAPNQEIGGVLRYGSSTGVPSRLQEPDGAPLTVVSVEAVPRDTPGAQWIAVLAQPPADRSRGYEVVPTAAPLGLAAAWNIGLRRAVGSVVALLAPGLSVAADRLAMLTAGLADESVGVVGSAGVSSADLRRWRRAPAGDVDALDAELLCFRRRDAVKRGPLDERFSTPLMLSVWWSLVLRDEGHDRPSRRALAIDVELNSQQDGGWEQPGDERASRRDLYRLIDRFGRRFDLLREPVRPTAASAKARRLSR